LKNRKRCFSCAKLLPGLFLAFTLLVFAPLEMYISNAGEFWFKYSQMLPILLIAAAVVFCVVTLLVVMLPPNISRMVETMAYVVTLLLYVQGNYLTINYGTLNGIDIDWSAYTARYLINGAFWIVVIAVCAMLCVRLKEKFVKIMRVVALILLATQIVTLATLGLMGSRQNVKKVDRYLSNEGELTVSSKENTVVLLLDCFDSSLFKKMNEAEPERVTDLLKDFTYYPDTAGGATRTKYAIPFIFTGISNLEEKSYGEYIATAYPASGFVKQLHSGDYDARLYTKKALVDLTMDDVVDNIYTGESKPSSRWGLTKDFLRLVAFRYVPNGLSRYYWMYSGDFDKWKETGDFGEYAIDDAAFYRRLSDTGLSVDTDKAAFRFVHLHGAHGPYMMDENCNSVPRDSVTEEEQAWGALKIVATYLDQMRRLGVYDDATIIIMADHGFSKYAVPEQNPLFLVKLKGQSKPLEVSDMAFSFQSMPEVFASALRGDLTDMSAYAAGGTRYFYYEYEEGATINIVEYAIDGPAYDLNNVKETGRVFHGNSMNRSFDYKLGDEVSFDNDDTARAYIVNGFGINEGTHTWTVNKDSEMAFRLDGDYKNLKVNFDLLTPYNGIQPMLFYANDVLVAQQNINSGGIHEFIIPGECVTDGMLKLHLHFPLAISPTELGTWDDDRQLALALKSMTISSTDEAGEMLSAPINRYDFGTKLSFEAATFNAGGYIVSGFSRAETGFTWSDGTVSRMLFNVPQTSGDLRLDMRYITFNGNQTVRVLVNRNMVEEYTATGEEDKTILIPGDLLVDNDLELTLELPDAISPKSLDGNPDDRVWGLGMISMSISEVDVSQSVGD